MRENWKDFHRKQDPPVNQSQTRGHDVCHTAIKPSMQSRTPSVTTQKKKKKEKDQKYIYKYINVCKYLIIPNKNVHLYEKEQTFSYSCDRLKPGRPQE